MRRTLRLQQPKHCFLSTRFLYSRINISVRPARLEDVSAIARFNVQLAQETEARALDLERVTQGVAALLADPAKGTYFVAEVNREFAGQLLLTNEWSDWRNGLFWWIQSVYVAGPFRGGVFRALFRHVEELARQRPDICGLRLYMDTHNGRAAEAYRRLGLRRTDYEVWEIDFVLPETHSTDSTAKPI